MHVYTMPGVYQVWIGVTDAGGGSWISAVQTITVTAAAPTSPIPAALRATTVATPKVHAVWRSSRLDGRIELAGTIASDATLELTVRRHGGTCVLVHGSFSAAAGSWSHTLRLPATLAPGRYDVDVAGTGLTSSQTAFTLVAPRSGIVSRSFASVTRHGRALASTRHVRTLWAHFVLGTDPARGQKVVASWTDPRGRAVASATHAIGSRIDTSFDPPGGGVLATGHWRCVLRAGGVVLAVVDVRVT